MYNKLLSTDCIGEAKLLISELKDQTEKKLNLPIYDRKSKDQSEEALGIIEVVA